MRVNSEALRAIRERTGLSAAALSKQSGVDPTVISRLEKGERKGTPAQLKQLADALAVPVTAIVTAA